MSTSHDPLTSAAYHASAGAYSDEWLRQPEPTDVYRLLDAHLVERGATADVGCGNGRDAHWLATRGFSPVVGLDPSEELLAIARRLFPDVAFRRAELPRLEGVDDACFDNVVCETVIMHLSPSDVPGAVAGLLRVLKPGGVLYLSWRVSEGEDRRLDDGRLYSAFPPHLVADQLAGRAHVLHFEDVTSASSGKRVCRVVAKKATG